MYSLDDKAMMEREAAAVRSLGFDAEFTTTTPLPFDVAGAVRFPNMAQFHPLKFLYGAAKGLNIFENTFVQKLDGTTAINERGEIQANKVIVATHFPFINSHGLYSAKLYQQRSYVIALENAPELGCTIEDVAENGVYLRNYNGLLLVGGGGHRTGQKGDAFAAPRAFAERYFPHAKEKLAWANQDCVSLDGAPYIGAYSKGMPNVYVASGFNLWGMTSSMVAAEILADLVQSRHNEFAAAFAPNRSILTGQLFANMGTTLLNFVTPTTKRCSHLGCALKWNSLEHSWDCPCHGSRFEADGKLIDSPAMKDSRV
ncbi:MAG: FAD-dependent oxidoreductase [Clostridia bacterium]|nr:FAD-dependent oxidoreductase [Clostridia bacterium]NLS84694.1 FAD-dependent oxidoreductase [Oscillospiraceae bacterium]